MGEGKIGRLHLYGLVLFGVFIGLSIWTAFVAVVIRYDALLLSSLLLNLVLLLAATVARHGRALLLSWVWLGADFVLGQAFRVPRINYVEVTASVIVILLVVDLSNFLELVYPMRARAAPPEDEEQYERTWSLVKRHTRSASLFITSAGLLGLAGIAFTGPLSFAPDPVLAVGVVVSALLFLTVVLSFERRPGKRGDTVSKPSAE